MGRDAYINVKIYSSKEEKERLHQKAFSQLDKYIHTYPYKDSSYFEKDDWFNNEIMFDKEINVTPTDTVCDLIQSKSSFIPEEIAKQYYEKYQEDILMVLPEYDNDGLRRVVLEKDDVLSIVQSCCRDEEKKYECQIDNLFLKEYKKDDCNFMAFILDDILKKIESEVREWKYTSKKMQLNENGKLELPYTIIWSCYYQIIELAHLINDYDWNRIDVVLYSQ